MGLIVEVDFLTHYKRTFYSPGNTFQAPVDLERVISGELRETTIAFIVYQ